MRHLKMKNICNTFQPIRPTNTFFLSLFPVSSASLHPLRFRLISKSTEAHIRAERSRNAALRYKNKQRGLPMLVPVFPDRMGL